MIDSFGLAQAAGEGVSEVRTESLDGGPQRLVALMDVGEGGQTWLGPSWAQGRLFYYKSCLADPSGCVGAGGGVFGFDPIRNAYVHASSATVLAGFAMDDNGANAVEALSAGEGLQCGDVYARPCVLRRTGPLVLQPTGSQVREP